jgi:hypothetical protein
MRLENWQIEHLDVPSEITHVADYDDSGEPAYRVEIGSDRLWSEDGRTWLTASGEEARGSDYQSAVILLRGGPRDGEVMS